MISDLFLRKPDSRAVLVLSLISQLFYSLCIFFFDLSSIAQISCFFKGMPIKGKQTPIETCWL